MKTKNEKKILFYIRNKQTGKLEIYSNQPVTFADIEFIQKQLNCKVKNYPYNL